jgi:hypothetical protein
MQDAVEGRTDELALALASSLPALAGRHLLWVSPLARHGYAELKDGAFLEALGLGAHREALAQFWPQRGPNWDALAVVDSPGRGVVLVEAKAHLGETPTPDACGASPRSLAQIEASMRRVREYLGVPDDAPSWTQHHYQVANRLAHLYWLQHERGVRTWLVFLGFTNSPDWPRDPLTITSWQGQVAGWLEHLGLPKEHPLSDRVGVATMTA